MRKYASEVEYPDVSVTYSVYEVFYRREGKKISRLFRDEDDALTFRFIQLRKNRRKFLGMRKV